MLRSLHRRSEVSSFLRFATVGGLGTLTDVAVLNLLRFVFGWPILVANTISIGAAILQNYWLHRLWTFADRPRREVKAQLAKFTVTSLIGLLLSNLMLQPLVSVWHRAVLASPVPMDLADFLSANLGKLSSIAVVLFWNYASSRLWTFRS